MRAGLLKEIITLQSLTTETSASGQLKRVYTDALTIKAQKKKISTVLGDGVEAKEAFIGNTVVLQCRFYPEINDKMRVIWQGRTYGITLLDKQLDSTYIMTCTKVNT